ncbi:DUF4198 domain-containing protein [Chitiniphilus eburneus]|uniref:DUF4198 domain-containing protein n=1 Tax=Chitiniphilus eburneus TaxID=2571148 RepID=A0A4U0Q657_9NEIS|nr:DUF4198 domain-containing protein [Chitiniphilus eburneus]TJZ75682.1 DUF4198 domain-containing protein [Chitiniphilus eburneus]
MNRVTRAIVLAVAAALPLAAQAHSYWLLPSSTVLSSPQWITVDAAVSNDMFQFNHNALNVEALAVVAPDGSRVAPENASKGKLRSTFDLSLTKPGTYRLEIVRGGIRANWKVDGQPKRWMGSAEAFAKEVPADAEGLEVSETASRLETFVTVGAPTALKTTGKGLELAPVTHPNDLFAGETATFQFLADGKPAAGVEVTLVRGERRYRNQQDELKLTTDKDGRVSVKWPQAGMYWLDADLEDDKVTVKAAKRRTMAYTATLEVLPQ